MRILLFAICLSTALMIVSCTSATNFDRDRWRNADLSGRDRANMLPSFLKKYSLKGMPREQVIALLGHPTETKKWPGADMVYILGNDGSLFAIDNEWLLIKINRYGRVSSYKRGVD